MSLDAITLVIEPPRDPLLDVAGPDAVRSFYEYDRFAAALATHTRAPVTVIEALVREAPARGALLVHTTGYEMFDQCDPVVRKQTAARTLVLNGGRATLIQKLDQYRFAGGSPPSDTWRGSAIRRTPRLPVCTACTRSPSSSGRNVPRAAPTRANATA